MNQKDFDKLLDELDTMDLDDLYEDDFHGAIINLENWRRYCQIVKVISAIRNSVENVRSLTKPNPSEDFAAVTVTLPQIVYFNTETKNAFALASAMCDRIAATTLNNKTRISFIVSDICKM